nr:hypothetical protein CFP56_00214 [Quercus suber]
MSCALSGLHDLIVKRLLPDLDSEVSLDSSSWIRVEKAVVTYVMFATADSKEPKSERMSNLKLLLDFIQHRCQQPVSTEATHAAQTLMWKAMGAIPESDAATAEGWCLLLRHPIFANAGRINKARIWRRALQSALYCGDLQSAREVFFTMPMDVQNESLTRYLCFKLALRSKDAELAYESLDIVASGAQNDPGLLFACVLDAQQSDMRRLATVTLLKIVDHRPLQVHLPSLLRCAIRLLMGELEANGRNIDEVMIELLHVIETAASNLKSLRQGTNEQSLAELQWWSKNTYNLAIQFCTEMNPEHLVGVLQACMKFSDCYTANSITTNQQDSRHRQMLCRFLSASALIVLARAETGDVENSVQYYLRARQEIAAFQSLAAHLETDDTIDDEAMLTRAFELLKFDLEAIFRLQQWNQLDASLQSIVKFRSSDCWESAIDLLFTIHDHAASQNVNPSLITRIPDVLQKCTNESWKKDKDIHKMSRWLRLIFTLHLESCASEATNLAFALKIVSQAAAIAKRGYDGKNDPYPADELAWLATTAFNKSVDLLVLEDDIGADAWIAAALEMARYGDDEGRLHASLTANKKLAVERRCGRTAGAAAGMLH